MDIYACWAYGQDPQSLGLVPSMYNLSRFVSIPFALIAHFLGSSRLHIQARRTRTLNPQPLACCMVTIKKVSVELNLPDFPTHFSEAFLLTSPKPHLRPQPCPKESHGIRTPSWPPGQTLVSICKLSASPNRNEVLQMSSERS